MTDTKTQFDICRQQGRLVLGYVSTRTARRSRQDIDADISKWYASFTDGNGIHIDGIFLDEGPELDVRWDSGPNIGDLITDAEFQVFYKSLVHDYKTNFTSNNTVLLNAASFPKEWVMQPVDVQGSIIDYVILWEKERSEYVNNYKAIGDGGNLVEPPGWWTDLQYMDRISHTIYLCPEAELVSTMNLSRTRGAGNVYIYDRDPKGVDGYASLPSYWDQEVALVRDVALEAKWVTGLYADLLSRTPDQAGLNGWVASRLARVSLQDVVNGFLSSNEYCTKLVTSFYLDLLGRQPEPAGLQAWVGQLQAGTPRQVILIGFLDSAEFKANNAPPDQFVESLYTKLLGRASDPVGKQGWIGALAAGASTAEVIRGFLTSEEYCTQQISNLYTTLLARAPDPVGLAGWVGSMMTGTAFQEIQRGFLVSDEYRARRGMP